MNRGTLVGLRSMVCFVEVLVVPSREVLDITKSSFHGTPERYPDTVSVYHKPPPAAFPLGEPSHAIKKQYLDTIFNRPMQDVIPAELHIRKATHNRLPRASNNVPDVLLPYENWSRTVIDRLFQLTTFFTSERDFVEAIRIAVDSRPEGMVRRDVYGFTAFDLGVMLGRLRSAEQGPELEEGEDEEDGDDEDPGEEGEYQGVVLRGIEDPANDPAVPRPKSRSGSDRPVALDAADREHGIMRHAASEPADGGVAVRHNTQQMPMLRQRNYDEMQRRERQLRRRYFRAVAKRWHAEAEIHALDLADYYSDQAEKEEEGEREQNGEEGEGGVS
ncbi:hypothetical protein EJ05DRAFT_514454 [Pseudovirgaria hyperparasitica]|uniref:Uncharacterized protein n=1 Tax=Pseudovirgaria hyperparasitica TaxID=470096 RepID=A0A6A6VXH7_9PEZI|nr:uncharacterized protein EJ05DRAFT_514454 [Pseudovirgaria hyperparasitica]KAF2753967.1 hypothetical protein EJ05DRAFT_514454 [Pseudovirgaria hyperparasitica]